MQSSSTASGICPSADARVRLFALLYETNARLSRTLGTLLEETCSLPLAWFDVLLQIRRAPDGRLKMTEIADATVHSTGGTTRLVDRIEQAGFVERQHCPNDRRAIHVAMTLAGNAKLDEALILHLEHLDGHLTDRLNTQERETLTKLLSKLNCDD